MKVKSGFELRNVCGEHVIVAYGEENIDFSKVISLNESAAVIWKKVVEMEAFSLENMAAALEAEYEVEHEMALHDVTQVAKEWTSLGLISD